MGRVSAQSFAALYTPLWNNWAGRKNALIFCNQLLCASISFGYSFISLSAGLCLDTGLYAHRLTSRLLFLPEIHTLLLSVYRNMKHPVSAAWILLTGMYRNLPASAIQSRWFCSEGISVCCWITMLIILPFTMHYTGLQDTCKKNDVVYFYFLRARRCGEPQLYINLGFYWQPTHPASTISIVLYESKTWNDITTPFRKRGQGSSLVTDACHSGDLAGKSNRGNF